jgi:DNA-directed RNA polymerase II subunit RPB2
MISPLVGEMERDVMISHGTSQFLKERLVDSSDIFRIFVGKKSETIVVGNPEKGIYRYDNKDLNPDEVVEVQLPYAMKLFYQELTAMGIDLRLITEKN